MSDANFVEHFATEKLQPILSCAVVVFAALRHAACLRATFTNTCMLTTEMIADMGFRKVSHCNLLFGARCANDRLTMGAMGLMRTLKIEKVWVSI